MGLIKAYAIYKYGRLKGELAYREACQYAEISLREKAARSDASALATKICSICSHRYEQHSDSGQCPTYDDEVQI